MSCKEAHEQSLIWRRGKISLEPPTEFSLEQYLDFIGDDELLEVTPQHLRLRKKYLSQSARRVADRGADSVLD